MMTCQYLLYTIELCSARFPSEIYHSNPRLVRGVGCSTIPRSVHLRSPRLTSCPPARPMLLRFPQSYVYMNESHHPAASSMSSHRPQRFGQMELYQRGAVMFFGGHANGLYGILRSRIPSSQEKVRGREGGILNLEIPRSVRAALGVLASIRHVDVVGLLGFRTQGTMHDRFVWPRTRGWQAHIYTTVV